MANHSFILKDIENYLETYTLEEILEENELTVADALLFMVEQSFVELPPNAPC